MTIIQLEDIGVGLNVALSWEEALHNALMPVTPQASMGSLADSKSNHLTVLFIYCSWCFWSCSWTTPFI